MKHKMKFHLLEPYRSALIAQATNEKLISFLSKEFKDKSLALKAAGTPEFISETLQLAVLSENLSMVFNEPSDEARERGLGMERSGIESLCVVDLIGGDDSDSINIPDSRKKEDFWLLNKEDLDAYQEFILSQLHAEENHTFISPYSSCFVQYA